MSTPCVVAVRTLCDFTAKAGDLDLRFTPSPTAQEGIAGHLLVASRRAANYESEISLTGVYTHHDQSLIVRGRADGYDAARNRLEEIKTFRGDLNRMPANHRALHWAQVKIYGWLLCCERALSDVTLALVYFNIGNQQETVLEEVQSATSLHDFFDDQCQRFLQWSAQEAAHRQARDLACSALAFPYPVFRTGQRELAQAVFQGVTSGRCVLAQAPTGIGKTIGTIFPLLKAAPSQQLDKIFYLAAKTSGRQLALDAVALIQHHSPALKLRVVELVARDKACEHPDKACHGDACPLARGFYDRLPAARSDAVTLPTCDQQSVRKIALAHQICPYYLSHELVRWSDVVIGDYNYYFDTSAMLYALTIANQWQIAVLVDEAHNLIERSRKMYSAELDQRSFGALRRHAPEALRTVMDRLHRQWNALINAQELPYQVWPVVPEKMLNALQRAQSAIGDFFVETPTHVDPALQRFFFDVSHFLRLTEVFDLHSLVDLTLHTPGHATLCVRNVIPAPFLAPRFKASRSTILFSATVSPWHFYSDTLGLPADTAVVDVASPFSAAQLQVHLVTSISTRYQDRHRSLLPIVELIAQQFDKQAGNYLTFVSSFDYLQQITALFAARHPMIPLWIQTRGMDETERSHFLERFRTGGSGIGFAVLGGAFSEGIDLPGDRLVGAFIATLGLPQINPVNEQMRLRMDQQFGNGYETTYLFPGLQKVVQAAGRVIRSQSDRGVVFLIDERYRRSDIQALLPRWWRPAPLMKT